MAVVAALATPHTAERLARLAETRVAARSRPAVRRLLARAAERLRTDDLLRPAACCTEVPVEAAGSVRVAGAETVAVGVVTIGEAISEASRRCFAAGDAMTGVLLDQLGTVAVAALAERLEAFVRAAAHAEGRRAGSRIHPGDRLMPLTAQDTLLDLAGAAEIGAQLGPTRAIHPIKSLSLVMAIGPKAARWSQRAECAQCPSRLKCPKGRKC